MLTARMRKWVRELTAPKAIRRPTSLLLPRRGGMIALAASRRSTLAPFGPFHGSNFMTSSAFGCLHQHLSTVG